MSYRFLLFLILLYSFLANAEINTNNALRPETVFVKLVVAITTLCTLNLDDILFRV